MRLHCVSHKFYSTSAGGSTFEAASEGARGLKPASQLKAGSVMDILGKGSQKSSSESITKPAAELKSGKFFCGSPLE